MTPKKRAYAVVSISFETELLDRMEELRGKRTRFRSRFVSEAVREKLGLPVVVQK